MKDILARISPDEALRVLTRLAASDSGIRDRIIAEAEELLKTIDIDEVTEEVFSQLDSIEVEELWDRAGPSRNGYTSAEDMAVQMIEEVLYPFDEQVTKYLELDMAEQAKQYCMGVLKGLCQYDLESKSEFKDWATDIAPECFGFLLDKWRKKTPRKKHIKEMHNFISEQCPKWSEWAVKR